MIDLFGIKKDVEPVADGGDAWAPDADWVEPDAASGSRKRPKLWGALLLVDSVLLIVFGGAVAAKLYQHVYSPVDVVSVARHRPVRTPVPTPAPPITAGALASAPMPAATAGPKAAATQPPVLSRSVEQQPSRARVAPETSRPAEKRHSVPVEFKLKAPHARGVQLAGAFIVHGGRREMARQDDGVWTLTLYLLPGANYRYWFLVNGKKTMDPENSRRAGGASVLVLP
jgi:hypothetical protein